MDEKEHSWHDFSDLPRSLTIIPWLVWSLVVLMVIIALSYASQVKAGPIAQAESQGIVITVYTEPCKLPAVSNLPVRATWVESGKTYEGCAAPNPPLGIVIFYFEDKTVAVVPLQLFVPMTGA